MKAFCWADGIIGLGGRIPDGAIEIARGPKAGLNKLIVATSRHGHASGVFLVPGIPEALTDEMKIEALRIHCSWLACTSHHKRIVINPTLATISQGRIKKRADVLNRKILDAIFEKENEHVLS